jgi:negative regulator of flagellin synthesis FlgM
MPPIEVGRTEAIRAISTALTRAENGQGLARAAEVASPKSAVAAATVDAGATVEAGAALDPGQPPIDVDRVAKIRKAVETGTYPVVPAKIADAMIAAGMMLRSPKA